MYRPSASSTTMWTRRSSCCSLSTFVSRFAWVLCFFIKKDMNRLTRSPAIADTTISILNPFFVFLLCVGGGRERERLKLNLPIPSVMLLLLEKRVGWERKTKILQFRVNMACYCYRWKWLVESWEKSCVNNTSRLKILQFHLNYSHVLLQVKGTGWKLKLTSTTETMVICWAVQEINIRALSFPHKKYTDMYHHIDQYLWNSYRLLFYWQ